MLTDIKKAAASGILISIGGCVLLASTKSGMMWAGAVLFSLGLFAICEYGFNLYTGKVGYIAEHFKDFKYIRLVLLILVVNLISSQEIQIKKVGDYLYNGDPGQLLPARNRGVSAGKLRV